MSKPKIIIVLGSQGSGKSTVTRALREKMSNTSLISLSSIENDNSKNMYLYHRNILDMLLDLRHLGCNFIFDRFFICNEVYSKLGLKDYSFDEQYGDLKSYLKFIEAFYDVYIFILATNREDYEKRLAKRNKFEYVKMSAENSMKQQREYLKLFFDLKDYPFENTHIINNTGMRKEETINFIMNVIED